LKIHHAVVLILLVVSSWQTGNPPHVYVNQALGFAVNYPDTLRPIVRDPKRFGGGEMGWEMVLDFVTIGSEQTHRSPNHCQAGQAADLSTNGA